MAGREAERRHGIQARVGIGRSGRVGERQGQEWALRLWQAPTAVAGALSVLALSSEVGEARMRLLV